MLLAVGFLEWLKTLLHHLYVFAQGLGGPGLLLVALLDSSFLSVPEGNDLLIVVLSTGRGWSEMTYYVTMTIIGSVSGCSLLYAVGRRGGGFFERRLKPSRLERARQAYRRWGVWAVVVPSILPPPTPFKIFVLSAGLFRLPFSRFFVAVLVGRSIRYFMWGILAVLYGEAAKRFIQQNLPAVGVALALALALGLSVYIVLRVRRGANSGAAV
jgi:membrane protein YqaA with SNARE-associated domain